MNLDTGDKHYPAGNDSGYPSPTWAVAGFKCFHYRRWWGDSTTVRVPHWSMLLTTAIVPGVWLVTRRRARRRAGCCLTCGYNLTGNTSGVCPECGTPTSADINQ